jgi:single-strand DNA-binding protein
MANLNKVMLIGRLTRDPEVRSFANGGKIAKFGFAVNYRKKNMTTNQWEDEPVFVDVEATNRGEFGKQADHVEQYFRKGQQVFIEGHLRLDQWTSPEGQKRSRLFVRLDNYQFLEPRRDGDGGSYSRPPSAGAQSGPSSPPGDFDGGGHDSFEPSESVAGSAEPEIPF